MVQFAYGWFGSELPTRHCNSTYEFYQTVPEIPSDYFLNLNFLAPTQSELELKDTTEWSLVINRCIEQGYDIPKELRMIMGSEELRQKVPSCTACYFDMGSIITVKMLDDLKVLLFYRDQQDCVLWYYILSGDYQGKVLASFVSLDNVPETFTQENLLDVCKICANSVGEFIYREWIENVIWFDSNGEEADESIQGYIEWYMEAMMSLAEYPEK